MTLNIIFRPVKQADRDKNLLMPVRSCREKQFLILNTSRDQLCIAACSAQPFRRLWSSRQDLSYLTLFSTLLTASGNSTAWRHLLRHLLFFPHFLPMSVSDGLWGLLLSSFGRDLTQCVVGLLQNDSCQPSWPWDFPCAKQQESLREAYTEYYKFMWEEPFSSWCGKTLMFWCIFLM